MGLVDPGYASRGTLTSILSPGAWWWAPVLRQFAYSGRDPELPQWFQPLEQYVRSDDRLAVKADRALRQKAACEKRQKLRDARYMARQQWPHGWQRLLQSFKGWVRGQQRLIQNLRRPSHRFSDDATSQPLAAVVAGQQGDVTAPLMYSMTSF